MIPQLRDYQQTLADQIRQAYAQKYRCPLVVASTGAGKTILFSYVTYNAAARGTVVLISAHRKEIIRQISLSLAKFGVQHQVIGPPAMVRSIKIAHFKAFGRSFVDNVSTTMVGSVQTIVSRFELIDKVLARVERETSKKSRMLIVMDECFPAGTLIDGKPIESLKVGDVVRSVSHNTGMIEERRITRLFKSTPSMMCTVTLSDGQKIACTPSHPFFIPGYGYFNAKDLKRGMPVVRLSQLRQPGSAEHQVPGLQGEEDRARVLQQSLLKRVQSQSLIGGDGCHQQALCIGQDEGQESNGKNRSEAEDGGNASIHWSQAADSWREWDGQYKAPGFYPAVIGGIRGDCGVCAEDVQASRERVPALLQDRRSNTIDQASNRGGWIEPSITEENGAGRQEGAASCFAWVAGVEVHEPESGGGFPGLLPDGHVYNIEVEGNHNYFADGILVHNCHHVVEGTQWGRVMDRYCTKEAGGVGLMVTASPERLDGTGLGLGHGGYADTMIEAPPMGWLIKQGYLSRYRVFTTPHQINLEGVHTRMGDYVAGELQERVDKPSVTGDAIKHYQQHARGMRAVVFCVSVEHSKHVAAEFNAAGIPSAHIDGSIDDSERDGAITKFADGELVVLTQVNLVSEGFDLGSIAQKDVTIDCIIDLAPTQSLVNAMQRWGRALRPAPGKVAVLLDHAGNILRHGFPDDEREWSLEGRKKGKRKADNDNEPDVKISTCPKCFAIHRPSPVCPVCTHVYQIKARKVEQRDGELAEIGADQIDAMRRARRVMQGKAQTREELIAQGINPKAADKILAARAEKQQLRDAIMADIEAVLSRTGEGLIQSFGVTLGDIRKMKPKELKALQAQVVDKLAQVSGGHRVVNIAAVA